MVVAIAAAARCLPFMAPGVRFDSDQATVGLMAKHISEGRAFPVYFYGQSYLLAVEAYLAAPFMWVMGPSEVALKLPVLLMNVALAVLLVWRAHVDVGLPVWLAAIAALPVIVPPIVPGTRLMEAMGGNVATLLYAMLFWTARLRPWTLGALAGLAVAHREMSVFALAALMAVDIAGSGRVTRELAARWARSGLAAAIILAVIALVRPAGAMFGPGTSARPVSDELTSQRVLLAQAACIDPVNWPARVGSVVREHLPLVMGGQPGPLQVASVNTGVGQGNPGTAVWVLGLALASLACATLDWRRRRVTAPVPGGSGTSLPWFLILTGLVSTAAYTLAACSAVTPNTLRYNLLVLLVPVGLVMAGLRASHNASQAGLATATAVWAALGVGDYRALAEEIHRGNWPDHRAEVIAVLDQRGLRSLWGDYRLAYALSFLSGETITVAATDMHRIDLYAERATEARAPKVKSGACAGGEELVPGIWLCPMDSP